MTIFRAASRSFARSFSLSTRARDVLPAPGTTVIAPAASLPLNSAVVTPVATVAQPVVVKRTGFFRGGLAGFLVGLSLAGCTGYVYLLQDYRQFTNVLLSNIEDLEASAIKVRDHTGLIRVVDEKLESLSKYASRKQEVEQLRTELLQAIDDVNFSHLELKSQFADLSADFARRK